VAQFSNSPWTGSAFGAEHDQNHIPHAIPGVSAFHEKAGEVPPLWQMSTDSLYQRASSLLPSIGVKATEFGPLVELCPADPLKKHGG